MEQTKIKFIAQYYGQNVLMYSDTEAPFKILGFIENLDHEGYPCYLSLRSVSQLTDEEKIEFSKIPFPNPAFDDKERIKIADKYISDWKISYKMGRYLVSIGICLDETAVAKGWVKLKED